MFNVAQKGLLVLKGGVPAENPMSHVTFEREHNERDRVLSAEEFTCVFEAATDWLKPMLLLAYSTGMRRGEVIRLCWEQVNLKRGVIRLRSGDTKTDEGRVVPMTPVVCEVLAALPRGMGTTPLFLNPATGEPYTPAAISLAFQGRAARQGYSMRRFMTCGIRS